MIGSAAMTVVFSNALVNSLLIPLLLALLAGGWRLLARPGHPTREDALFGFDLLVAAFGVQLAFLATDAMTPGESPELTFQRAMDVVMALGILGAMYVSAILMRIRGYDHNNVPTDYGLRFSNISGFVILVITFLVNYQWVALYHVWTLLFGESSP
jgi:hypothetical protein